MYYFISNSEDGIRVSGPYDQPGALREIEDLTSEDLRPECRAVFVDAMPDPYTPTHHVFILKGEAVIPEARARVTEWSL